MRHGGSHSSGPPAEPATACSPGPAFQGALDAAAGPDLKVSPPGPVRPLSLISLEDSRLA